MVKSLNKKVKNLKKFFQYKYIILYTNTYSHTLSYKEKIFLGKNEPKCPKWLFLAGEIMNDLNFLTYDFMNFPNFLQ